MEVQVVAGCKPNVLTDLVLNLNPDQTVTQLTVDKVLNTDNDHAADLLLQIANDGTIINGTSHAAEDTGETGNGTAKTFTATIAAGPVVPGSVSFYAIDTPGVTMTLTDGGDGHLYDEDGADAGTVDYFGATPSFTITFPRAVKNAEKVFVNSRETVATATNGSAVIAPLSTSKVFPLPPYWGTLTIKGMTSVAKQLVVKAAVVQGTVPATAA